MILDLSELMVVDAVIAVKDVKLCYYDHFQLVSPPIRKLLFSYLIFLSFRPSCIIFPSNLLLLSRFSPSESRLFRILSILSPFYNLSFSLAFSFSLIYRILSSSFLSLSSSSQYQSQYRSLILVSRMLRLYFTRSIILSVGTMAFLSFLSLDHSQPGDQSAFLLRGQSLSVSLSSVGDCLILLLIVMRLRDIMVSLVGFVGDFRQGESSGLKLGLLS